MPHSKLSTRQTRNCNLTHDIPAAARKGAACRICRLLTTQIVARNIKAHASHSGCSAQARCSAFFWPESRSNSTTTTPPGPRSVSPSMPRAQSDPNHLAELNSPPPLPTPPVLPPSMHKLPLRPQIESSKCTSNKIRRIPALKGLVTEKAF